MTTGDIVVNIVLSFFASITITFLLSCAFSAFATKMGTKMFIDEKIVEVKGKLTERSDSTYIEYIDYINGEDEYKFTVVDTLSVYRDSTKEEIKYKQRSYQVNYTDATISRFDTSETNIKPYCEKLTVIPCNYGGLIYFPIPMDPEKEFHFYLPNEKDKD